MKEIWCGDCLELMKNIPDRSIDAVVTDPPYGLSFMGKKWDYDVPSVEIWSECLRVLKPGGYLLSFAGTRTQHRMAVRIEDAGFEIRDMIAWVYGSGFPKSLNIGKAVDKIRGNEREDLGEHIQNKTNPDSKNRSWQSEEGVGNKWKLSKGTSEWEGWGTALKPALEPITVARKPLEKGLNVAQNCLKWCVGGINIDGCRVGIEKIVINGGGGGEGTGWGKKEEINEERIGRFPANLIHDGSDEVVGLFPQTKSGKLKSDCYEKDRDNSSIFAGGENFIHKGYEADSGSAARYFYCAKASKSERNRGCEDMEEVIHNDGRDESLDSGHMPQIRSNTPKKNFHPTVKPIALMEYLVKLVSREGALVLDPFAGSGSTGIACQNLNLDFILIEREPQYVEIIKARLSDQISQSIKKEQ